jgi:hypothetical protein
MSDFHRFYPSLSSHFDTQVGMKDKNRAPIFGPLDNNELGTCYGKVSGLFLYLNPSWVGLPGPGSNHSVTYL